ncbi:thioredoxin domain-containing protein [Nocardia sp. NPDC052112]|uniref:thioredoxin family protein n=1 Tax=Nocardia sp. NPDC052112 TaxID=3155646 RepID=UPI00343905E5
MSATTIPVSIEAFRDAVLDSESRCWSTAWADWCGPCSRLAPTLAQLADAESDRLVVLTAKSTVSLSSRLERSRVVDSRRVRR